MENLLASYLLKNRICPLPGLGSLQIFNEDSKYLQSENLLTPPKECIALFNQEISPDDLIEFIAFKTNSSYAKAEKKLNKFAAKLRRLEKTEEVYFPYAGLFKNNGRGRTEFVQEDLGSKFYQPVHVAPVSKANASHQILVGDTESTTAKMQEYFAGEESPQKQRWYIAAVILFCAGLLALAYLYFTNPKFNSGTQMKIAPGTEQQTYTTDQAK